MTLRLYMEKHYDLKSTFPVCLKIFGFLTLLLEGIFWFISPRLMLWVGGAIIYWRAFLLGFIWSAVGYGLLLQRKWAAILFCIATSAWGIFLIIGSIIEVPFPYLLINVLSGLMFLLPIWITIHSWHCLSWRGGWKL